MATIKDVAKLAQVSVATVSRVLNKSDKVSDSARDTVLQAMAQLGYRPNANARALVNQTSDTMGLLVGDVSDPFFGALAKSVETVARESGKHLLIGNGLYDADKERQELELLISKRCDSLVVHAKALSDAELVEYAQQVPGMVIISRYIEAIAERCIALDDIAGARLATEHLIAHGHRRIVHLKSSLEITDTNLREQGYRMALREAGIELPPEYIETGYPNEVGGEQAMLNLLSRGVDFSAVVSYNDGMAAGAISVLADNGISVPEQVSVIGFDDVVFARFLRPKLTTMRYPVNMMAVQAAQLSMALAEGKSVASGKTQIFMPTLISRNSVARCSR